MVFVHSLGFKNSSAWNAYCRGQRKDLPTKPADVREEDIELKSEIEAFFDQHDRKRARPRAKPIDLESIDDDENIRISWTYEQMPEIGKKLWAEKQRAKRAAQKRGRQSGRR